MDQFKVITEEIRVLAKDAVELVGKLLHEGNVRRVIVRDAQGHTFMEVPVVVAAAGVVVAPVLAAVGALTALVADFKIVVERVERAAPPAAGNAPEAPPAEQPSTRPPAN